MAKNSASPIMGHIGAMWAGVAKYSQGRPTIASTGAPLAKNAFPKLTLRAPQMNLASLGQAFGIGRRGR